MKLTEAKRAMLCYLDQVATVEQMKKAGLPITAEEDRMVRSQVEAMVREIERCRSMGKLT